MKTETLLDLVGLALRTADATLQRRRPVSDGPDTPADRLVQRVVLPMAEKALGQAAPAAARPAVRRRRRRRGLTLGLSTLVGAVAAGAAAYTVVKQQQRVRERYRPLHLPFPPELLEVLAAPGGAGRLEASGDTLTDHHSGAVYAIIDGIPDFIAPAAPAGRLSADHTWMQDFFRPVALQIMGRNSAGNAALAATVAGAAGQGWMLSAPSGRGSYEIEMARANPRARVLCLSNNWDVLLEVRRGAQAAGLTNLYFVRGVASLLPVRDRVMSGVWSGSGLHLFLRPERELTQMVRVTRPGSPVAGLSLVRGGPALYDLALRLGAPNLPGLRGLADYLALLEGAGLKNVRLFRDGGFVRFTATRA
jgi:SAM-dependent methyltransferase